MVRSAMNIILFVVVIVIFLFLFTSPTIHGFVTPSPYQQNQDTSQFQYRGVTLPRQIGNDLPVLEQKPIYISPSKVKLITPVSKATAEYIPEDLKRNQIISNLSPTGSVAASTLYEVNMEFIKPKFNPGDGVKPMGFTFDEAGRRFGSMGEKFCVKTLETRLGRQVMIHYRPAFLKNPYGKGKNKKNLELDMYDPITNIAIEYNGEQHYKYVPSMHGNMEGFEYQKIKDEFKIKRCKEMGVHLIIVPYTVDMVPISIEEKLKCDAWSSADEIQKIQTRKRNAVIRREKIKEDKIRNYLLPKIDDILAGRIPDEI